MRPEDSPEDYVSQVEPIIYHDHPERAGEGVSSITKKFREATTELFAVIARMVTVLRRVESKRWWLSARNQRVIIIK